jgi:xylose isomerase
MDTFARALVIADKLLKDSDYLKLKANRYASYDSGKGAEFEAGKLNFTDLYNVAKEVGEPKQTSGRQEMLEQLINCYI